MEEKNVIRSFRGNYDFSSNRYPCTVKDEEGLEYGSVERAYQASKSWDIRHRIACQLEPDEKEVWKRGRDAVLREDWDKIRVKLMFNLLKQKFENPKLRQKLLETGDALLLWGNPHDRFWGQVGDEGENQLGKHLMKIRTILQNQEAARTGAKEPPAAKETKRRT